MLHVDVDTVLLCSKGSEKLLLLLRKLHVLYVRIGRRLFHILTLRSSSGERGKGMSIPTASARPQHSQTWMGWGDAGPHGAGDRQWVLSGTASHGVRQRHTPHWEYNPASALKRAFLSSREASLLLLLVRYLFFHVW